MEWKSEYWPLLPSRFVFQQTVVELNIEQSMLSLSFPSRNCILYYCDLPFWLPCLFQQILFFFELGFKIEKWRYSEFIQYLWSCSGRFDGHVGWPVSYLHPYSLSTVIIRSWLRRIRNYSSEWLHMTTHPSSVNGSTKRWWFIPSALKLPVFRGKGLLLNKEMLYPTESRDIIELLIREVILNVDLTAGFLVEGN